MQRLREATTAARDRLESGLFALRERTAPAEPIPDRIPPPNVPAGPTALVQMDDFASATDDEGIPVWEEPSD